MPINSVADIVAARQSGRALAVQLGFSGTDATLLATAISELARNIVLYAGTGEIVLTRVVTGRRTGIRITARDGGPGIGNVQRALMSGYSSSGGLGLGLPGVRRIVDEFEIDSAPGKGTLVVATMWMQ